MEPVKQSLYPPNPAEMPTQHAPAQSAIGLDRQFQFTNDLASARHFFSPVAEVKPLAIHTSMPGLEHTAAAAAKAAAGAISPMLQLIMHLPTHVSIFSSFLDALKSFILPHSDIFSHFANFNALGIDQLGHTAFSLVGQHGWSIASTHAHIFQSMAFDSNSIAQGAKLHLSAADTLKHSMNVSAGPDLQHPQFEQLSSEKAIADGGSGITSDTLAGPGISTDTIAPQLAPAERIFSINHFDASAVNSNATNMLSGSPSPAISNTANNVIAMAPPSVNQVPVANSNIVDTVPIKGLHAKELSLAGFSKLHNSMHAVIAHSPNALSHARVSHSSANGINHHAAKNIASAPEMTESSPYTIRSGDTLWGIAQDRLGDGFRWQEIYKLNADSLGTNPNLIYSGTSVHLPHAGQNIMPESQFLNTSIAHHPTVTPHAASVDAHHSLNTANQLHKLVPDTTHTQMAHAGSLHIQPAQHQMLASTVTPNVKLDSTVVQSPSVHISMHPTANNGLNIESAHDQLLSGAGGAQASNLNGHGSTITKTSSNLPVSKAKSVVSFTLAPDLSSLFAGK